MKTFHPDGRWYWLSIGLAAGLAIAFIWPHEPVAAGVADRNDKFAMVTAQYDVTNFFEAVFILDFLTGQLRGSVIDPTTGNFTVLYARNIAADFNVNPNEPATYAIVSGRTNLNSRGANPASSCLYIAELASGKVVAYSFAAGAGGAIAPLVPMDSFSFRPSIN